MKGGQRARSDTLSKGTGRGRGKKSGSAQTLPQESQVSSEQEGGAMSFGARGSALQRVGLSLPAVAQKAAPGGVYPGIRPLHPGKDTQGRCSHHQGGLGHRWLGSWDPGRSCSHHSGPSTSRCCRQLCPPTGQVPEDATPSTGQGGRGSREARHPIPPRSLSYELHPRFPASGVPRGFSR